MLDLGGSPVKLSTRQETMPADLALMAHMPRSKHSEGERLKDKAHTGLGFRGHNNAN